MAAPAETESEAKAAASRKRKHTGNEDEETRVIKHRSSKACRSCRARKVRCDVATKGTRCTNCELDELECIVLPSRRGQSRRISRSDAVGTTELDSSHGAGRGAGSRSTSSSILLQAEATAQTSKDGGYVPAVVTFDDDDGDEAGRVQQRGSSTTGLDAGPSDAHESIFSPETRSDAAQHHTPHGRASLPSFIAPLPTQVLPEDLEYLISKGAFVLPERDLCVEILRAYLFSVHPFMPVLNVDLFIRALVADDGHISLLLFQAVMFAGLHSLRAEVVLRLGFQTPKQAREVFFNKVRLLYDFNVETDNAALLQSLILMSSWYSKHTPWNERRHTWHWTGLAYDLARSMGLHRKPANKHFSKETRRFRRRLWWSLYIRDRLIALGTRRPMRIHNDEFDVVMLTLDDFDLEWPTKHWRGTPLNLSKEDTASSALMCIQLARLCTIIGEVVSSQYTTLGHETGPSHTMMVMPRRDGDHTKELEECEKMLNDWNSTLASNVGRLEPASRRNGAGGCAEVHWAQLNMTYLTVVNVLHRAQALRDQTEHGAIASASRSKVKNAARGITRLGQELLQQDQVRFLGLVGVTALIAACLTHMLDAGSGDEDVRDASTFRLYQTLQVLQALRQVYASADSAFSFLASITRKAGMYLPTFPDDAGTGTTATASSPSIQAKIARAPSRTPTSGSGQLCAQISNSQWSGQPAMSGLQSFRSQSVSEFPLSSAGSRETGQDALLGSSLRPTSSGPIAPPTLDATPAVDQVYADISNGGANDPPGDITLANPMNGPLPSDPLDWNTGLDAGLGFGSMPFTYDFFSDAFGFLDGESHGL